MPTVQVMEEKKQRIKEGEEYFNLLMKEIGIVKTEMIFSLRKYRTSPAPKSIEEIFFQIHDTVLSLDDMIFNLSNLLERESVFEAHGEQRYPLYTHHAAKGILKDRIYCALNYLKRQKGARVPEIPAHIRLWLKN